MNETFGGHNTGAVALGYALAESLRGYVSYGTAFKAPTFTQLYYPGFFGMYEGNRTWNRRSRRILRSVSKGNLAGAAGASTCSATRSIT